MSALSNKQGKKSILLCLILAVILCFSATLALFTIVGAKGEETYKKSNVFALDGNILEVQDSFALPTHARKTTPVGESDTGVAIFSDVSGATFTYKNEIDFTHLSKDDNLIEYYALWGGDYSTLDKTVIKLTDAVDSSNFFEINIYTNANGALYALLGYNGKNVALSNEGENSEKVLFNEKYGTWCSSFAYNPSDKAAGSVAPFSVSVDYAEKKVFVNLISKQSLVLDLDNMDHVGKGFEWKGFTNNKATLSVSMSFVQAKKGGVVVKSIMGKMLDGVLQSAEDFDAPDITFVVDKEYLQEMPFAQVGSKYRLPDIFAYDWFFGECSGDAIKVEVFKKLGASSYENASTGIEGNYFTPTEEGEYEIRYTVSNPQKSAVGKLTFNAVQKVTPVIFVQEQTYQTPVILTNLYVPNVFVYGGSGKLNVKESLYYNGQEIQLTEDRNVYLDKAGIVSLKVECTDYLEETVTRFFPLEIQNATVLFVSEIPLSVYKGEKVTLPKAVAYNSETGANATVTITANGQTLGEDRKFTVGNEEEKITVIYSAETSYGVETRTFEIPVINNLNKKPSTLMLTENGGSVTDSNNGLILSATAENQAFYWSSPVVTGASSADMKLFIAGEANGTNFEYVDVNFANYKNVSEKAFIRIYSACDKEGMSYIQPNGAGAKYLINGSLKNTNTPIKIYVNTTTGYVYDDVTKNEICAFSYAANVSKVGFSFGGLTDDSSVRIQRISNQSLNYKEGMTWRDNTEAVLSYNFELANNLSVKKNETVYIPLATAYDMIAHKAEVEVKVLSPKAEVILNTAEMNGTLKFTASEIGTYDVVYAITDGNGVSATDIFSFEVYETIAPILTIASTAPEKVKVNSKILVPTATANDDTDGACLVNCYLQYVKDGSLDIVEMGSEITLDKEGEYKLIYYTFDSFCNFVRYEMNIKVEK